MEWEVAWYGTRGLPMEVTAPARRVDDVIDSTASVRDTVVE